MKAEVQLLNEKGRAVPTAVRRSMRKFVGALCIKEARDATLARSIVAANLLNTDQEPVLPQLYDAVLLHAENGRMRIRGFEIHEGVQTCQTWDVKVLPC